jgi:hypothetical protein
VVDDGELSAGCGRGVRGCNIIICDLQILFCPDERVAGRMEIDSNKAERYVYSFEHVQIPLNSLLTAFLGLSDSDADERICSESQESWFV